MARAMPEAIFKPGDRVRVVRQGLSTRMKEWVVVEQDSPRATDTEPAYKLRELVKGRSRPQPRARYAFQSDLARIESAPAGLTVCA
jgi:hypothetical protein